MMMRRFFLIAATVIGGGPIGHVADPPSDLLESADTRFRRALAIGRENNDRGLVERLDRIRGQLGRAVSRNDRAAVESLLREAEAAVGLEAGGKTMHGLPIAQVPGRLQVELGRTSRTLAEAMAGENAEKIHAAIAAMGKLLGDQAGIPDVRRKTDDPPMQSMKRTEAVRLFFAVVRSEPAFIEVLRAGKPKELLTARTYASAVEGLLTARSFAVGEDRKLCDELIDGGCRAMSALQTEGGFFKFPDLRGKHIRFGAMVEKLVEKDISAVADGWVVVVDPEGGSQFDAGECGIALLRAGKEMGKPEWTKAGRRAADWAESAPMVPNFNYNAFSVSLLCEAFRQTGEITYRDAALKKWRLGVAPGFGKNGRWIDPHNARLVYHVILTRSALDVLSLEGISADDKKSAQSILDGAVRSMLDEAVRLGSPTTSLTIQVLSRSKALLPDATAERTAKLLATSVSTTVQKCVQGKTIRAAVPLPELAAAVLSLPE